jgi:ABC-type multidrug transport system fused ATPase/permease subunit
MSIIKIKDLIKSTSSFFPVFKEITFNTKGILPLLALMLLLVFVSRAFIGLNTIFISYALDQKITGVMGADGLNYLIALVGLGYLFVFYKIVETLFTPIIMWIAQVADTITESQKVNEAIDCLIKLPNISWKNVSEAELALRLNVKSEIRMFFFMVYRNLLPALIEISIAIFSLIYLNIYLEALIILVVTIVYVLLMVIMVPKLNKKFLKHTETEGKMSSLIVSLFENSRLAKSYNSQSMFIDKFKKELEYENKGFEDKIKALTLAEIIPSLIIAVAMSLIFYIAYSKLSSQEITVGVFSAIMAVCATILANLKHLTWTFTGIMQGAPHISFPINILLNCRDNIQEPNDIIKYSGSGFLEVKNLGVEIDGKKIINNISFSLNPGEKLWLLGKSGSGKTTMMAALNGFLDYTGEILLDGESIRDKFAFGWVPQSSDVVTGTIKFNLLIGNQNATEEKMWDVLKKVDLKELIEQRGGLMVKVENESNFSGGECQRIAIARALISERPILIMDEPASALDVTTEKDMIKNIIEMNNGAIVSVHRIHSIPSGSRIIFLKEGRIIQDAKIEDFKGYNQ